VVAFCRIDDKEIRVREPIAEPDELIVQDPTLPHQVYVFGGVGPDGYILINSARSFEDLGLGDFAERFHRNRCPDNAVLKLADSADANVNGYAIDLDYCQGCGMCASECPCGAIRMEPEAI
jgi:pyruvate ferredoxin oxidoreductase gamma subunit